MKRNELVQRQQKLSHSSSLLGQGYCVMHLGRRRHGADDITHLDSRSKGVANLRLQLKKNLLPGNITKPVVEN